MRTKSGALGSRQGSGPTAAQIAAAGAVGVLGALGIRALVTRRPSVQLLSDEDALERVQQILTDLSGLRPLTVEASELAEISGRLDDVSKRSVVNRTDFVVTETTDQLIQKYTYTRELLQLFSLFQSQSQPSSDKSISMQVMCQQADNITELLIKGNILKTLIYDAKNRVMDLSQVTELKEKVKSLSTFLTFTLKNPTDNCVLKAFKALAAAQVKLGSPQMRLTEVLVLSAAVEQIITANDALMDRHLKSHETMWTNINLCKYTFTAAKKLQEAYQNKTELTNAKIESMSIENHARNERLKKLFSAIVDYLPRHDRSNCDNSAVKKALEAQVNSTSHT